MSATVIQLDPVFSETLSPERFLEIYKKEKENIEAIAVVPAKLGSSGFGKIVVRWKRPTYQIKPELPTQEDE